MGSLVVFDLDGTRKKIKALLDVSLPDFSVALGGATSSDVTFPGIDKAYGIGKLRDVLGIATRDMIYVGDALFPGGNDASARRTGATCIQIRDPDESKRVIEHYRVLGRQPEMSAHELNDIARRLVAEGKGALTMDESDRTCNERFADVGIPQTYEARCAYRKLLVTTSTERAHQRDTVKPARVVPAAVAMSVEAKRAPSRVPWPLALSFARALQHPALVRHGVTEWSSSGRQTASTGDVPATVVGS